MNTPSLEKRIAAALGGNNATSAAIAALLEETETAILAAEEAATKAREQALDPIAAPDAVKARQSMEDAAFTRDRLRALLPRLRARYQEVITAEELARWLPQHEAAKAARDALAAKLHSLYIPSVEEFVPLLLEIEQADREARRVNEAVPRDGTTGMYLRSVEEAARGPCERNTIMKDLRLPAWEGSAAPAWPPPFNPGLIAAIAPSDRRRHSAEWWKVKEEEARAQRERQEREIAE